MFFFERPDKNKGIERLYLAVRTIILFELNLLLKIEIYF